MSVDQSGSFATHLHQDPITNVSWQYGSSSIPRMLAKSRVPSDVEEKMPPRPMKLVTLITFIGLVLGVAGVSYEGYPPGGIAKAAI